ncbi:hypothetical protein NQ318_011849 [Aromia moschata]|uniref:Uncharacterized protein n=1 Tax=Aromia moschata TaxID=1265417 RepID=A0AAV8XFK9_9CUCU|nr:hypothetical protein NQ318_011849 [Aromia moschata]
MAQLVRPFLQLDLEKCEDKYPNAAKVIRQDFYVDDMIRKWVANDPKILDGIEKSRWSSYSIKFGDNTEGVSNSQHWD